MVGECEQSGLHLRAASDLEVANVLWSQDEKAASVKVLRDLAEKLHDGTLPPQMIEVGRSGLLAKLVSEKSLQRPSPF